MATGAGIGNGSWQRGPTSVIMAATVRTQYRWMSGQMVFRYGWRQAALTVGVAAALLWMLLMGRTQGWEMHRDCMDRAWHQGLKTVEAAQLACSRPRF